MATVIERHGYSVDGLGHIHYDDSPSSFERAEEIIGRRLDRRKNYAIIGGKVCESLQWSQDCSGCLHDDGTCSGCEECGYTGIRRRHQWMPLEEE